MTIQELIKELDVIKKQIDVDEWLNSYTLNIVIDNITKIQNKINKEGISK